MKLLIFKIMYVYQCQLHFIQCNTHLKSPIASGQKEPIILNPENIPVKLQMFIDQEKCISAPLQRKEILIHLRFLNSVYKAKE